MAFKFVVFAALIAAARAGVIGAPAVAAPLAYAHAAPVARYAAPVAYAHAPVVAHAAPVLAQAAPVAVAKTVVADDYDPHPQYSYGYDIQDGLTGDSKNQQESRDGDVVHGSYSLTDPDGTRRTVEYTADPINGFNAVVHKEPLVAKAVVAPAVAKVAAPVAYAAPLVAFTAVIAVARAGLIGAPVAAPLGYAAPVARYAAPVAYAHAPVVAHAAPVAVAKTVVGDDYDPHPQYSYGYDIQDGLTGDSKNQQETRDGDVVHGSYSLTDPDGTRRTVEYTADPINGFNAVVHKEPLVAKAVVAPAIAKVAAPLAYAAPVAKVAAPLAYAAPVAKYYH
ncbi:cuticle protein-like [Tribolium madens]|uniref:cuticle protein-like n=1 Tax=Tribolium madens TaxID=41895 RepID=UPI001CF72178|nr:cuticle protein-like [Tribolium madens]